MIYQPSWRQCRFPSRGAKWLNHDVGRKARPTSWVRQRIHSPPEVGSEAFNFEEAGDAFVLVNAVDRFAEKCGDTENRDR